MKKLTLLSILLSAFASANASANALDKFELIGIATFGEHSASDVCKANGIIDSRCESGEYKALSIISKFDVKGTFGAIALVKNNYPNIEKMDFKNVHEGKQMPFVKVRLAIESGKPAELVEVVKSGCFWSIDASSTNGSGGAVCQKLGFNYHTNSDLAMPLKNPSSNSN